MKIEKKERNSKEKDKQENSNELEEEKIRESLLQAAKEGNLAHRLVEVGYWEPELLDVTIYSVDGYCMKMCPPRACDNGTSHIYDGIKDLGYRDGGCCSPCIEQEQERKIEMVRDGSLRKKVDFFRFHPNMTINSKLKDYETVFEHNDFWTVFMKAAKYQIKHRLNTTYDW